MRVVMSCVGAVLPGGYSGGFEDGPWACFNPFRSFVGPIGGVRSRLEVDRNHLRAFHNAVVVCVNQSAWGKNASAAMDGSEVRSFDLGDVQVCADSLLCCSCR